MRKLLAYNPQPVQCTSQQRHTTRRLPSPRLPAVTPVPAYCCSAENPPRESSPELAPRPFSDVIEPAPSASDVTGREETGLDWASVPVGAQS